MVFAADISQPQFEQTDQRYMDDYLSPEQLSEQGGNERSDIYALGTILYEMLTGHTPGVGRFITQAKLTSR